jgi:uncharacterized protein (TIGR02453 family)
MAFTGFDRDAMQFFHELSLEMNRDWYDANKQRYTERWVEPMTALLETVAARLAKTYAPIKIGTPKLFRIHRDVRFSKDKTPYKTHCAGMLPLHQAKKPVEGGCTVLYLHLGVDDEYVGAGTYFFDEKQLPRWRKLVAAPKSGAEVSALITRLRKAGYAVGGHEDYKKVPKGFAPDHPRADLLRMRGLTAAFPPIPRGLVHKPKFVDWIVDHSKKVAPLVAWLHRNVK